MWTAIIVSIIIIIAIPIYWQGEKVVSLKFFERILFYLRFHKELLEDLPEEKDYTHDNPVYVSRSMPVVFKQLQDPKFQSFAIHNELTFSMYNYKKKSGDRLFFYQLEQKMIEELHLFFTRTRFLFLDVRMENQTIG